MALRRLVALVALALACTRRPPVTAPAPPRADRCAAVDPARSCAVADSPVTWRCTGAQCCPAVAPDGALSLDYVAASEPVGDWSHMLSGLWYDHERGAWLALQDNVPAVVWMRPDDDTFTRWSGGPTGIALAPHGSVEALTGVGGGALIVGDEDDLDARPSGPHLFHTSAADAGVSARAGERIEVPAHLRRACDNSGFEAASVAPGGRSLVAAVERALTGDEPGVVRVLVTDLATGTQRERAYRMGPDCWCDGVDAGVGVAELVALSATHALVLERAWRRDRGSCARIFLTDLAGGDDVTDREHLDATVRVAPKRLVLDLATLPRAVGLTAAVGQTHPLLGNYEGMALGPCMADGRRAVVLVTDDNDDSVRRLQIPPQPRRVLTLGARGL